MSQQTYDNTRIIEYLRKQPEGSTALTTVYGEGDEQHVHISFPMRWSNAVYGAAAAQLIDAMDGRKWMKVSDILTVVAA
jgi:hypothetical protein